MPAILFVCTANQFRSPLAAACLLSILSQKNNGDEWVVESAGTWTTDGMPALPVTLKNAERFHLQGVAQHHTRQVNAALLDRYQLIIVMEAGHKEALLAEFKSVRGRVYMLSEVIDGIQYDIPDPVVPGVRPEDVASELQTLITNGADKIFRLACSISSASQIPEQGVLKK